MQYGICEWCAMAGGEALFQRLQRIGLPGLQVSYETDFAAKMAAYTKWAAAYGVTLTSVGANIFCERPFFRPENRAWVEETVADVCRGAALTESRMFHVPSFGASTAHGAEELAQTAEALALIARVAEGFGVTAALETPFSLEENRALLAAHPALRLYFDTQNPQTTPHADAAAQAAAFCSLIPEVHVKDCDGTGRSIALGAGVTGCAETVATLVQGGYDGWMHLENAYDRAEDPEAAMKADAAWLARQVAVCRS